MSMQIIDCCFLIIDGIRQYLQNDGFSGFSGMSGVSSSSSGFSGYRGVSGFSGFSGLTGVGTSTSSMSGYNTGGSSGFSGMEEDLLLVAHTRRNQETPKIVMNKFDIVVAL